MCNLVIKGVLTMGWMSIFLTVMIIVCYGVLMKEALMNKKYSDQFVDYEEINDDQDEDDDV